MTQRERLIELLTKQCGMTLPIWMAPQTIELLADALLANGVIVPPCKVGDTVYSKDGKAAEIEDFCVGKEGITAQASFQCDYDCNDCAFNSWHTEYSGENSCDGEYGVACVSEEQFGKTVFLTREEAMKEEMG